MFHTHLEELLWYSWTFFIIIPEDDLCMTARSCWLIRLIEEGSLHLPVILTDLKYVILILSAINSNIE